MVDANGAAYYFQPQTGESSWEPPVLSDPPVL